MEKPTTSVCRCPEVEKIEASRSGIESDSETQNFRNLIDNSRKLFSPDAEDLVEQTLAGTKINKRRVSDIGIGYANDYSAGIMSEMITSGENWAEWDVDDPTAKDIKDLAIMTQKTMDSLLYSNFTEEIGKAIHSSCVDGTVCFASETSAGEKIVDRFIPFGSFWFVRNFFGIADTVWVEKETTAGALVGHYGKDGVSLNTLAESKKSPNTKVKIIYYCAPKKDRKKGERAFQHIIYEKGEKNRLESGESDYQVYSVYAVRRINNETYGRGPCITCLCGMAAIERKEKDIQRADAKNACPCFAIPASNGRKSFRWMHDQESSTMIYDDVNGSPPIELTSGAKLDMAFEILKFKADGMRSMFFLDYFNPLQDRKNMTLGETRERVQKSHQMVSQIVSPLEEQLLTPVLQNRLDMLLDKGVFAEIGTKEEILARFGGKLKIKYTSRLANAQKRIRLISIMEAVEAVITSAAQLPPESQYEMIMSVEWTKIPKEIFTGTNAPLELLRPDADVKQLVDQFNQANAQRQQLESAVMGADAASKMSQAQPQESQM